MNHLSKAGKGMCAYIEWTLETYRLEEQSAMTQVSLLTSLDLSLTKTKRGTGAAGEKAGNHVYIGDAYSQRLDR